MQKIEIVLEGTEAEECARLINDLARAIINQYDVAAASIYCGHAALKRGFSELQLPPTGMQTATTKGKAKDSGRKRKKR